MECVWGMEWGQRKKTSQNYFITTYQLWQQRFSSFISTHFWSQYWALGLVGKGSAVWVWVTYEMGSGILEWGNCSTWDVAAVKPTSSDCLPLLCSRRRWRSS